MVNPIMQAEKTAMITMPARGTWSSLCMHISCPSESFWQIIPGAQVGEAVIVEWQMVFPTLTEQYDVVIMVVVKQTRGVVVLASLVKIAGLARD
jgi:hypothetical protein